MKVMVHGETQAWMVPDVSCIQVIGKQDGFSKCVFFDYERPLAHVYTQGVQVILLPEADYPWEKGVLGYHMTLRQQVP